MNFIEAGDRVRILRGRGAGKTGIVTFFNHGNKSGVPYKQIVVKLNGSDVSLRFRNEGALEKVEEDQPDQPLTAPNNDSGKP